MLTDHIITLRRLPQVKNHERRKQMLRIAQLRKAQGISQAQLARDCGVSAGAVAAWEVGRNCPTLPMAVKIAAALHCKIDDLYDGGGDLTCARSS